MNVYRTVQNRHASAGRAPVLVAQAFLPVRLSPSDMTAQRDVCGTTQNAQAPLSQRLLVAPELGVHAAKIAQARVPVPPKTNPCRPPRRTAPHGSALSRLGLIVNVAPGFSPASLVCCATLFAKTAQARMPVLLKAKTYRAISDLTSQSQVCGDGAAGEKSLGSPAQTRRKTRATARRSAPFHTGTVNRHLLRVTNSC